MPDAAPAAPPVQTAPLPSSRLPKEGTKAYAAFQAYCQLGPERSLTLVAQGVDKNRQLMGRWSARYHWQERVATYDREQAEVDRQAAAQAALERARVREKRKEELTETVWHIAKGLEKKLSEMMAFPTHTVKMVPAPDGGSTMHIHPAKWDLNVAARFASTLKELAAFAVGVPSSITAHTDREGEPLPGGVVGADGALVIPEVRISIVHTTKEGAAVAQPKAGVAPVAEPQTPVPGHGAPVKASSGKPAFTFQRSN